MIATPFRFALASLIMAALLSPAACAAPREPVRAAGGTETVSLPSGGLTRSYDIYRPAGLTRPAPVVIMLHGGGGNAGNGAKMTGFNALAAREGFVAVYPNGTGEGRFLTWNAGHCCAYSLENDIDDVGFISDLIEDLVLKGIADRKRIYVTGMSNGAMMTHRIGRELSGKVAAIAPVVGAVFGDEAPAAGPVPALIITGLRDENVPAAGGNGDYIGMRLRKPPPNDRPYAPASAALAYWTGSNGCRAEKPATRTTAVYTLRRAVGCVAPVQWYELKEGAHAWPGGRKGSPRGDAPVTDFDASQVIWDFFRAHSLAD